MSSFGFEQHSRYCCLRFKPELSGLNWDQIETTANDVLQLVRDSQTPAVMIDLSAVSALPEGFIALLVRVWRQLHENQRRLIVVATQEDVQNELKRAGVDSLWTLTGSLATAESMLGGDPSASESAVSSAVSDDPLLTASAAGPASADMASRDTLPSEANTQTDSAVSGSTQPMEFEEQRGFCSVRMNQNLMSLSWSDLEAQTTKVIEQIRQSDNNAVMVDMEGMQTINSGLVASLVRIWKTMQKRNGRFSLVSSNEMVTEVLKTAGLWKLWTVVDERDEAVYQLGAGKVAEVEQRERRVLTLVAVPCAILSLLALTYMYASESLSAAVNAQVTSQLLAAAALATGVLSAIKDRGRRRYFSIAAVVIAVGVLASTQLRKNPIRFASDYLKQLTDSGEAAGLEWRRIDSNEEGEMSLDDPQVDPPGDEPVDDEILLQEIEHEPAAGEPSTGSAAQPSDAASSNAASSNAAANDAAEDRSSAAAAATDAAAPHATNIDRDSPTETSENVLGTDQPLPE